MSSPLVEYIVKGSSESSWADGELGIPCDGGGKPSRLASRAGGEGTKWRRRKRSEVSCALVHILKQLVQQLVQAQKRTPFEDGIQQLGTEDRHRNDIIPVMVGIVKALKEQAALYEELRAHEDALRAEQQEYLLRSYKTEFVEVEQLELKQAGDMNGIRKAMRDKTEKLLLRLKNTDEALRDLEDKLRTLKELEKLDALDPSKAQN